MTLPRKFYFRTPSKNGGITQRHRFGRRAETLPEDQLLLASECRVLDRHEGWLLAYVPTATLRAIARISSNGSGARSRRGRSDSPSMRSITR